MVFFWHFLGSGAHLFVNHLASSDSPRGFESQPRLRFFFSRFFCVLCSVLLILLFLACGRGCLDLNNGASRALNRKTKDPGGTHGAAVLFVARLRLCAFLLCAFCACVRVCLCVRVLVPLA